MFTSTWALLFGFFLFGFFNFGCTIFGVFVVNTGASDWKASVGSVSNSAFVGLPSQMEENGLLSSSGLTTNESPSMLAPRGPRLRSGSSLRVLNLS